MKFLNDLYIVDYSIARKEMIRKDYEGKDEALKRLIGKDTFEDFIEDMCSMKNFFQIF